ncbi:MAG TPA: hypothetical protein VLG50_05350 [Candidatus Saccharimonadales bacterium]|nr:hypothetical protein [Candidatus Saccharimonadales bacterium]
MDRISGLNANQAAKELQSYSIYQKMSQNDIKKKLGGVANLRNKLRELESQPLQAKSQLEIKTTTINDIILPKEMISETLLYSDIDTIVSMCQTSKTNQQLCNEQFWINKFKYENLPILIQPTTLNEWVKLYKLTDISKLRAEQMIKIILTYNYYKGDAIIRVWYDRYIPEVFKNYINFRHVTVRYAIDYEFDRKKNKWTINLNQENMKKFITDDEIVALLTINVYDRFNKKSFAIGDFDENELLYEELLKNSKQNKPIPRAYLMAYELLK